MPVKSKIQLEWYDPHWWQPETLSAFSYEQPLYFYGLLLIPVIFFFRWLFFFRLRRKLDVALFEKDIRWHWSSLLRFIPDVIIVCVLCAICIALARPQLSNERVERDTEGIDILLLLDISGSMKIEDFAPNRLEAAKRVAKEFIQGRISDRIGMVVFAAEAYTLSPLTTDYEVLYQYIDDITFDMIQKPGTAIGLAIGVGINRMYDSPSKTRLMILISDGDNTAGNIEPDIAAKLAKSKGIKIYTIGVGKDGLVPFGKDVFGNTTYVQNTMDESTLKQVAKITEGKYFRADNSRALKAIFNQIDRMEKTKVKESRFKETTDYYHIYLYWAVALMIVWMLVRSTFIANPLED
jgi:Ca-activated chloride channel family protein